MPSGIPPCENQIRGVRRRIGSLDIPPANRAAILAFADFCFAEGLSSRRVLKYLYTLKAISLRLSMEFSKATREDIEKLVNGIERSGYKEWTRRDFRITLKKFYRWLRQSEGYPPDVKWLRSAMRNSRTKLPEEILTPGEVQAMVTAATKTRDRALVAFLYEGGCRIGELLSLQIRQVQQHPHGFQVTVSGKTGSRRILLIACAPYLAAWLNEHPRRDDADAPLWLTDNCNASGMTYSRASAILTTIARRAGLRKAVNPHNFRHSRATHLATALTEAQMKEYFGWVQGSDMASTYVHLSGRDMDNALLKLHNIRTLDDRQAGDGFVLKPCRRCSLENPPGNKFCSWCGTVLDEETAVEIMRKNLERNSADDIMDRLVQDSEFREMLQRKIGELCTEAAGFGGRAGNS